LAGQDAVVMFSIPFIILACLLILYMFFRGMLSDW
jgi:hypothetical protein